MPAVVSSTGFPPPEAAPGVGESRSRPPEGIKLRAILRDDQVELWALDEVHFQQQGSRCRMWVPPETRDPVVFHHPTRKSVGYFAAVRIRDGRFLFRRETGSFNGDTFCTLLKDFRSATAHAHGPGHRHQRQRRLPPFPVAHRVEDRSDAPIRTELLAALQSGVESDRASLETDLAAVPSQSVFRGS